MRFHVPERVAGDLDLVVAPTVQAGGRLLVALAAVGHAGNFTPEDYAQKPRPAGIQLKPPQFQLLNLSRRSPLSVRQPPARS